MINWTIGQLGLGEAQVLGMSPQGTGKDKGGFARVEADLSSCLRFIFHIFVLTLSENQLYSQLHQMEPSANISVSHFLRLMYVCVKFFRC